jgi:predicted nuclease with TOPRIM domain
VPTPPKPHLLLVKENKSHRTKSELQLRKKGEEELTTGIEIKARLAVRKNKIAYKEFCRVNELLKTINKNDALYQSIINRYAMLYAECQEFEIKREKFYENVIKLDENFEELTNKEFGEMTLKEYFRLENDMQKTIIDIDKQIQSKRKMLLDIEKECVMTISSSLRSIPKKVDKKPNGLLRALEYDD